MQADLDAAATILENALSSSQNPQMQDPWEGPLSQDPYDYSKL